LAGEVEKRVKNGDIITLDLIQRFHDQVDRIAGAMTNCGRRVYVKKTS